MSVNPFDGGRDGDSLMHWTAVECTVKNVFQSFVKFHVTQMYILQINGYQYFWRWMEWRYSRAMHRAGMTHYQMTPVPHGAPLYLTACNHGMHEDQFFWRWMGCQYLQVMCNYETPPVQFSLTLCVAPHSSTSSNIRLMHIYRQFSIRWELQFFSATTPFPWRSR